MIDTKKAALDSDTLGVPRLVRHGAATTRAACSTSPRRFSGWCFPATDVDCWRFMTRRFSLPRRDRPVQRLLPRFADFGQLPPPTNDPGKPSYTGRIFKLSQDYPQRKPPLDAAVRKILAIDFNKDWKAYAEAVRDYIYEGN